MVNTSVVLTLGAFGWWGSVARCKTVQHATAGALDGQALVFSVGQLAVAAGASDLGHIGIVHNRPGLYRWQGLRSMPRVVAAEAGDLGVSAPGKLALFF
jgi:hypothetical protein